MSTSLNVSQIHLLMDRAEPILDGLRGSLEAKELEDELVKLKPHIIKLEDGEPLVDVTADEVSARILQLVQGVDSLQKFKTIGPRKSAPDDSFSYLTSLYVPEGKNTAVFDHAARLTSQGQVLLSDRETVDGLAPAEKKIKLWLRAVDALGLDPRSNWDRAVAEPIMSIAEELRGKLGNIDAASGAADLHKIRRQ